MPIGWLYGTYHLLREPETAVEYMVFFMVPPKTNMAGWKTHHEWRFFWTLLKMGISQPVMLGFSGVYICTHHFRYFLKWLHVVPNLQVELVSHWALRPKAQAGRNTYSGWRLAIFKGFFKNLKRFFKTWRISKKQGSDFYLSCLLRFFTEILFEVSLLFSNVRLSHSFRVWQWKTHCP